MRRLCFALLLAGSPAWAGGFWLNEESAAATAMAGAFTAKADGPEAIYYNAAGIAGLRGLHLYAGGMLVLGRPTAESTSSFSVPGGSQDARYTVAFVPNLYLSYGLPHGLAIGIGAFTNMGLNVSWPGDWAGRFLATYSAVDDVTINPTIAWQPVSWFAIGVGLDITPARVELRRIEPLVTSEAELRFRGNAVGVGGNVGVLFRIPRRGAVPEFDIGAHYRSRYNLDFNDGALQTTSVPIELAAVLHDAPATASVPIPDLVSVGIGVRPVERVFVQAQFDWTNWSRFQTLTLNAPGNPQLQMSLPQNWRDGYTARIAAELGTEHVTGRLGFAYDWSPVPSSTLGPTVPDADRVLITGGVGVPMPRSLALDFGVMGVIFIPRDSALPEFPVHYSNWAVLFSLGLRYEQTSR